MLSKFISFSNFFGIRKFKLFTLNFSCIFFDIDSFISLPSRLIAYVVNVEVKASIDGKLRGLLHDDLVVPPGFKIADIDPRGENADHLTISHTARAIAGGVLEVIDY